jgi:4-hydroxy-3-polyprenylbenzoate decarboxylase
MAVTGASGALYGRRLLDALEAAGADIHLVVSPRGRRLLAEELSIKKLSVESVLGRPSDRVVLYPYRDIGARIASGSFLTDGMVVCPCSTHSLAGMAAGLGDNLIFRAAAVTIKEARRLVLVPREMPWTRIDLGNALRLSEAGAIICPASPGFYLRPQTVNELVDFVAAKVLDLLGVAHDLSARWSGVATDARDDGGAASS